MMRRLPVFWIVNLLVLSLFLVLFLYVPVFTILGNAFSVKGHFSLSYFSMITKNAVIFHSILNSLLLGTTVTLLCVAVSFPLAWITSRYRFAGQQLLSILLLMPMVLPPFVGAIGIKQFFSRFGTFNLLLMHTGIISTPIDWLGSGFWGVAFLEVLHLFPIVYLNLSAVLSSIDPALEEAAHNLGTRRWSFLQKIILPLITPGLFAGCSIVFIWAITDLGTPLILDYHSVIAYQIFSMVNDIHENPMGYSLVTFLLLWVCVLYFGAKMVLLRRPTHSGGKGTRLTSLPSLQGAHLLLAWGVFAAVILVSIIPHCMVLVSSFADKWFVSILPEQFTTAYYQAIVHHRLTVMSMRNSIFLSSMTALVDCLAGIAGGYCIARFKFVGRSLLDFSVMLPLALPGLIIAFGYVGTFAGTIIDPRVNPFPLLIAAYSIRRLPLMVRSIDAGLRQLPFSLEEASSNLGASPTKTISHVIVPMIAPNIFAGTILVFSYAMLEVSDSLILAMKENFYPLAKAIYALVQRIGDGFPLASALGVITMILLAASLVIASKVLGKKMGDLFRM